MKKETIEKLIDVIGYKLEELQNTLNAKSQLWLNNEIVSSDDPNAWAGRQYATMQELQNKLTSMSKGFILQIESAVKDVYLKELKLINIELELVSNEEIKLPEEVQKKIDELTQPIKDNAKVLIQETIEEHKKDVTNVLINANTTLLASKLNVGVELKIKSTQILYDAIVKATSKGIQNMPKIVFSDGRSMNWKSYIEMQTRTQLKQEASDYQKESANQLGVIFWLLSSHFDCADDHAPYQGKLFINRNWESKVQDEELKERIKNFISSKKILFKEQIDEPGGLLERPIEQWNCRHYFQPLTIDQALWCTNNNKRIELLKDLKMYGGDYEKKNYEDLQQQRYNERKIRQYKYQLEKDNLQLMSAPKDVDISSIQKLINRDKQLVAMWQLKQRNLIRSNDLLFRDYRRESNGIVKDDLGAKYNK